MGGGVWHCFIIKHIIPKDNAAPEDAVAHVAHVAHVAPQIRIQVTTEMCVQALRR